jgi:hypothetical protein
MSNQTRPSRSVWHWNDISKDMGGVVTKEQVISRAQYLDLVYSYSLQSSP